jgi:perosamine synthetase
MPDKPSSTSNHEDAAKAFPEGPPVWPISDDDVAAALKAAYADGSWGQYQGRHSAELARILGEMHDVEHVQLCSSGTIAVELAFRGLKVGPGDEVILAGYDFSGNFRCVEAVGATPVLVDIDASTWCLDVEQVREAVSDKTSAIISSHLHGGLADVAQLRAIADHYGIALVEDACQSPGAVIDGRIAGTWGDVGILSFGGSKLLTAGRGGALLTRDASIAQRIKVYCEQGNNAFPLSELQAAVLIPQLAKLEERNRQRAASVNQLLAKLEGLENLRPVALNNQANRPAFYKFAWSWNPARIESVSREAFLVMTRAEGIAIDAGFRGFARRSAKRCLKVGALPNSQQAADATVVLHHPILLQPPETIDRLARAITNVVTQLQDK